MDMEKIMKGLIIAILIVAVIAVSLPLSILAANMQTQSTAYDYTTEEIIQDNTKTAKESNEDEWQDIEFIPIAQEGEVQYLFND